jgi:hypothetical protein
VSIWDVAVEPYVEEIFWQELARPPRATGTGQLDRLGTTVDRRERELRAYRDNARISEIIGGDRFAEGLAVRTRRLEQARVQLLRARPGPSMPKLPPENQLREQWSMLSLDERRALIGQVIEAVFVLPGKRKRGDRLFVCRRGCAPADLVPRHSRRSQPTQRFDPATCPPQVRLRRRQPDWSEERMRDALGSFLAGRQTWPSFRDFQAAGLVPLYVQIDRQVGHREMASILDLRFSPPNGPTQGGWSETRVRRELRSYLAGRKRWPPRDEFIRDGRAPLRAAVTVFGGPARWADELGTPLPDARSAKQRWSYIRLKHELSVFTAGTTKWPGLRDFELAGQRALYEAIGAARARERLAADLSLELPSGTNVVWRRRWTDDAIAAELDRFLAGRDRWPSWREFAEAKLEGLYHVLQQTGTREVWIERYGLLPPSRNGGAPAPKTRWTDEAIEGELECFLQGRTSWPRAYEFRDAGLAQLHLALQRAGTREAWAERYGLRPASRARSS